MQRKLSKAYSSHHRTCDKVVMIGQATCKKRIETSSPNRKTVSASCRCRVAYTNRSVLIYDILCAEVG